MSKPRNLKDLFPEPPSSVPEEFAHLATANVQEMEILNIPGELTSQNIINDFKGIYAEAAPYVEAFAYTQCYTGTTPPTLAIKIKLDHPANLHVLMTSFAEALDLEMERAQLTYTPEKPLSVRTFGTVRGGPNRNTP